MSTKKYAALMLSAAVLVASLQPAEAKPSWKKVLRVVAPIVVPIAPPSVAVAKVLPQAAPIVPPSPVASAVLGEKANPVEMVRQAVPALSGVPLAVVPGIAEWIILGKAKKKVDQVSDAAKQAAQSAQRGIDEATKAFKEFMDAAKKYGPMVIYGGLSLLGLLVLTLVVSLIRNIRDLMRPAHARR